MLPWSFLRLGSHTCDAVRVLNVQAARCSLGGVSLPVAEARLDHWMLLRPSAHRYLLHPVLATTRLAEPPRGTPLAQDPLLVSPERAPHLPVTRSSLA